MLNFSGKKIWITGHQGMLGSALLRLLQTEENVTLLYATRNELDLRNQAAVLQWVDKYRPDLIFHIGAKVGGIQANATLGADFLYSNLMIQTNVIDAAYRFAVQKLLFVASNCIYASDSLNSLSENALLSGPPDANIRSYAIAKMAGIEMCLAYRKQYHCNFIAVIPSNLYGPGDNYHPHYSHVVAGILRRAYEAKLANAPHFTVWGNGTARREILHVDDLAAAMRQLMLMSVNDDIYNIGCGYDFSIAELSKMIAEVVDYQGKIIFDASKPNGAMKKLLDSSRIKALGWHPKITEKIGLQSAYQDFLMRMKMSTIEKCE